MSDGVRVAINNHIELTASAVNITRETRKEYLGTPTALVNYYDRPDLPDADARHVQNQEDPDANVPLKAHIQYWKNPALRKLLYKYASVT